MTDRPGGPPSYTLEAYRERLLNLVTREKKLVTDNEYVK